MKQQSIRNIFLLIITISSGAVFAYGEAKLEVPDIAYETFTLDNGLTVVVHEDRKVPMAVSYTHLTLPTICSV